MRTYVIIDNVKCDGCATTITKKLEKIPNITNIDVEVKSGKVSFSCHDDECALAVILMLKKIGYPLSGTGTRIDKAKSVISCAKGKIDII